MNTDFLDIFGGLIIVGLVVSKFFYGDSAEHQPVANEVANEVANTVANTVANGVVNNTANVVTETEVYKVVCVAPADTFCKEYSVRRINRE